MAARESLALAGVALVAFAVRCLPFGEVFVGGGEVVLWPADGAYHARLALYSLANFPSFLGFDPYLNYPNGSGVPWPPLYTLSLAGICRLLGGSPATLEVLLALSPPVLGSLTTLPVYGMARLVSGPGVALTAAGIYALLGIAVLNSVVGNSDHHALVGFVGAALAFTTLATLRNERGPRVALAVGLGIARSAVCLAWSGSLLYLGLASAALLLGFVVAGRRDLLAIESSSSLLAALLTAPVVAATDAVPGGDFAVTSLSWFHVVALLAGALASALLFLWERWRPARTPLVRGLRAALVAGGGLAAVVSIPDARDSLLLASRFVGARNQQPVLEQTPLFRVAEFGANPHRYYGWMTYLIVLAPVAAILVARDARLRPTAIGLGLFSAVLGLLALQQVRFGNDFAAVGAVSFSLLLRQVLEGLRRFAKLPGAVVAVAHPLLAIGLLWPVLGQVQLPQLRHLLELAGSDATPHERVLDSALATAVLFAREVREVTPETRAYLDGEGFPEYGILTPPNLGHAIRYWGRRAASVDGFFEYLDPAAFDRAVRFFSANHEAEALEIARSLNVRYVATYVDASYRRSDLLLKLHLDDGVGKGSAPSFRHFRLVTEGPKGGTPQLEIRGDTQPVPYKLFEIVEGAHLRLRAEPGARISVELGLRTPTSRRFLYRASALAGASGVAELRVPYPTTGGVDPVRADGPYRVSAGGASVELAVGDDEVRSGSSIPVDLAVPGSAAGTRDGATAVQRRSVDP